MKFLQMKGDTTPGEKELVNLIGFSQDTYDAVFELPLIKMADCAIMESVTGFHKTQKISQGF